MRSGGRELHNIVYGVGVGDADLVIYGIGRARTLWGGAGGARTLSFTAAVPNLFGTRERFRGRLFFHGVGGGDGSGSNASEGG